MKQFYFLRSININILNLRILLQQLVCGSLYSSARSALSVKDMNITQ